MRLQCVGLLRNSVVPTGLKTFDQLSQRCKRGYRSLALRGNGFGSHLLTDNV